MANSDIIKAAIAKVVEKLGDGDEKITLITKTYKNVVTGTYENVPCIVTAYTADDLIDEQKRDLQQQKMFRFVTPDGASTPKRGDIIVYKSENWVILGAASGYSTNCKWRAVQDRNIGIGTERTVR